MKPINIAVKVVKERHKKGLSVRGLAKEAGVSHVAVKNIEEGMMPNLRTLIAVAKALGKSPAWFLQ